MSSTTNINDLAGKLSFYSAPSDKLGVQKSSTNGFSSSFSGLFGGTGGTPPVSQTDEESAGLMSWASAKITSVKSSVDDFTATRERITLFAILAAAGTVCMILAFTFLPFVIISPHKFALLFTMGSALMLASFSSLRGHAAFLKNIASWDRLPFSASYGVSLVGTLYASLVMGSYILTMLFSVVQVVALMYFLVSYIPGGTGALTMVGSFIGSGFKSFFVR